MVCLKPSTFYKTFSREDTLTVLEILKFNLYVIYNTFQFECFISFSCMIALVRASIVNQLLGTVQVNILDLVTVLGKSS